MARAVFDEFKYFILSKGKMYRRYKKCASCDEDWEHCPACRGKGVVDILKEDKEDNHLPELWVEQRGH